MWQLPEGFGWLPVRLQQFMHCHLLAVFRERPVVTYQTWCTENGSAFVEPRLTGLLG